MIDLKRAHAICEAATPGPLTVLTSQVETLHGNFTEREIYTTYDHCQLHAPAPVVCMTVHVNPDGSKGYSIGMSEGDAAFIAEARTLLPAALEEIERLREAITMALDSLEDSHPHSHAAAHDHLKARSILRAALGEGKE